MLPCYLKIHFKMKYCLNGTLVKLLLPRKIEMSWIEFPWCCQFPSSSLSGTFAHRMKGQCLPYLLNSWEPRDFCRQEEHTHFSLMPSYHPGTSLFSKQWAVTFPGETSFAWVLFLFGCCAATGIKPHPCVSMWENTAPLSRVPSLAFGPWLPVTPVTWHFVHWSTHLPAFVLQLPISCFD